MNNPLIKYGFHFVVLVLAQGLFLNNVTLHSYINPMIYPLFLMILPIRTPSAMVVILGFLLGLSVDIFTNTFGLHAAAGTLIGFVRIGVLQIFTPTGGYEDEIEPNIHDMGPFWSLRYIGLIVLIHHICFFLLSFMSLDNFGFLVSKILLSSLISLFLIFIYQFIFFSKKR